MKPRIALLGLLIVTVSCSERAAVTHAQALPVDRRYGLSRLDSSFELNDPYAAFERPKATVSATPMAIRERFKADLEAMFGSDSFAKAQLDSGSQIIVFNQHLKDGLEAFVLHVSDMIVGDQYFLHLKRGNQVSPDSWPWFGPVAGLDAAPKLPEAALLTPESINGKTRVAVYEWRHNGNVYSAWIKTLLNIGADLSLSPEFRHEAVAYVPFANRDQVILRTATYDSAASQYLIRTSVALGSREKPVGSAVLIKEGAHWKMLRKNVFDRKYEKLILTANPGGEQAIWENMPGSERAQQ